MRWIRSLAVLSWVLVAVLAAAGFAAFSPQSGDAEPSTPAADESRQAAVAPAAPAAERQVVLPAVSGRTAAFVLAEAMEFKGQLEPRPDPPAVLAVLGPDGSSTTTSTSTTTTSTTTTSTTTTTTTAPPRSTTTTAPPRATTTTAAPETTTTSEAPPADTTPTTEAPAPAPPGQGVERWRPLVEQYFRAEFVEEALWVMNCESGGNPDARNSRTGAAGLFQFMPRTWATASAGAGFGGASPYDGEANIASASWLVEDSIRIGHSRGRWGHWSCRP